MLQPNVIDNGAEIWVKKWVCIVYNKNQDQVAYQPTMSIIPQAAPVGGNNFGGVDMQSNASVDPGKSAVFHRADSYRSSAYEQAAMIEPPRRRLICQYGNCNKTFTDTSSLKKHQLTHGEKNFVCKYPS